MERCVISVKVTPGASRDEVLGWLGDSLKVRVQAPPTDGKANERLCTFLARELGLPRGAVRLATGASSRQKRVEVQGISESEIRARILG